MSGTPLSPVDRCALCREMSGELIDIVSWLAGAEVDAGPFAAAVVEFERRKLARLGFTLSSAISFGPVVHFSLRFMESDELCASMDVDPTTGAFEIQTTCG